MEDIRGRQIIVSGYIDEKTVKFVAEHIANFNAEDAKKNKELKDFVPDRIELYIDSYGGHVYEMLGIIGMIRGSNTPVDTYVIGKAMSAGMFIAAAGNKRYAYRYATFMYHGVQSWARGEVNYIQMELDESNRLQRVCNDLLVRYSNISLEDMKRIVACRSEWYITAEEALELGLIDEII
jgi:ATP-dependent Clp protease protease subunit